MKRKSIELLFECPHCNGIIHVDVTKCKEKWAKRKGV